jgi:hypothetical protein
LFRRVVGEELVSYGARQDEIDKIIPPCQAAFKATYIGKSNIRRAPMMTCLGVNVEGASPYHADLSDPLTRLTGLAYRIGRQKPKPSRFMLCEMRKYAFKWAQKFKNIQNDYDFSFEKWLEQTNYPEWRKQELRAALAEGIPLKNVVKTHFKEEWYTEAKPARSINAREDFWKCVLGPYIKAIEHTIFKNSRFAKYVPVAMRNHYIYERLWAPAGVYSETDFSQFESHFVCDVNWAILAPIYATVLGISERQLMELESFLRKSGMDNCWADYNILFDNGLSRIDFMRIYMMVTNPEVGHLMNSGDWAISGIQAEMSGEMDTSCKNGVTNAFLYDFFNFQAGHGDFNKGCFEGDDGVTVNDVVVDGDVYAKAGFTIKMKTTFELPDTDFCGMVGSEFGKFTTTDPIKVILGFGWGNRGYVGARRVRRLELLRAKALSFLHEYRGSPIIQAFAARVEKLTRHINMKRFIDKDRVSSRYFKDMVIDALDALNSGKFELLPPDDDIRLVVETRFGVTRQHQIELENYFDTLVDLSPLRHPLLLFYAPHEYVWHDLCYVGCNREVFEPIVFRRYDNLKFLLRHISNFDAVPR